MPSAAPNLRTDGTCQATCEDNHIAVANVCQACGAHCDGCTLPGDNDACSSCAASSVQVAASQCRAQCNPDQYEPANKICQSEWAGREPRLRRGL